MEIISLTRIFGGYTPLNHEGNLCRKLLKENIVLWYFYIKNNWEVMIR